MIKTFATVTALAALTLAPALAQTNPSTPSSPPPITPPAQHQSASPPPATTGSANPAAKPDFISSESPDQLLASSFKGTDVVGTDGKKIGDVADILMERDGTVKAYVVGVGGFLGIGAKEVALAPKSFQVVPGDKPNEVKLKLAMNKDELKQAPTFKPYNPPAPAHSTTTGMTGPSHPTGASAPRSH